MTARQIVLTYRTTAPAARAILVAAILAALTGCGGDSAGTPSSVAANASQRTDSRPAAKEIDRAHPVVRIETSAGRITVRLEAVRAPGTVRNFLNYANDGFYDNTLIHFVDRDKIIVAGGYAADRTPKPTRPSIRNEAHNGLKNVRGTIAMARDASLIDSATSQFFINLADAPQRDHQGDTADKYGYSVFGEVTAGLDVAERISQSPTTILAGDLVQTPEPTVVIKSIRIMQ